MIKRKVILDCDPGIDDAFALVVALKEPSFDVLGIHTVAGNVSVLHTTRNAQGLCHLMRKEVPIHPGNAEPLVFDPVFADDVHGKNGFNGYVFDDQALHPVSKLNSLEAYVEALTQTDEKITIIALGPLTNVAIFLKAYPHLKHKIECIALMGGGIKGGNITPAGEFNFYVDPHSADIVFRSGVPIVMAGLDITEIARLYEEDLDVIRKEGGAVGELLYTIAYPNLKLMQDYGHGKSIQPNDTVPVLYLLHPELFKGQDMVIRVAYDSGLTRGMSVADVRPRSEAKYNAHVLMETDLSQFRKVLVESITGGKT